MSDWPPTQVGPWSGHAVYSTQSALGAWAGANPASVAWPATNLAIFVPMRVVGPCTVYKMAMGAGATGAGNFDIGIYDSAGNRILHTGATAKGASTEQIIDVTDTPIGPGLYYLAMSADGTNNYIMITPSGTTPVPLQKSRLYGLLEMASAYPLPDPVTFAALSTSALIPSIAAYMRPH